MPNKPKTKRLPRFQSLDEEADFWGSHSPLDYGIEFEEVEIRAVRPLQHAIELDVDTPLLDALFAFARAHGVPFDEVVRRWIAEGLAREAAPAASPPARRAGAKTKAKASA
jgi:hypothetical protein